MLYEYGLKRKISHGASVLWHLRVAEGDHLTERSEGRKLPQHKTRAPALPCAAQASQTSPEGETLCPKGSKQKKRASASAKARYKSFCGDGGLGEGSLFL